MVSANNGIETPILKWQRDQFTVSTERSRLDLDVIHGYLHRSYWSPGIPREVVAAAMRNSFCFGLFDDELGKQIGYARVVTDFTTFAYLADVFVLPSYRGDGLGVWLVDCVVHAPPLNGIRTFFLATRDAQELYKRHGFETPSDPERLMIARYPMPWYEPDLAETYVEESLDG